jgi:hypothetical protein
MLVEMDESEKIDLVFHAADEMRAVRDRADEEIARLQRKLLRDLQEKAGMSYQEAAYELYMLGARINADALEA